MRYLYMAPTVPRYVREKKIIFAKIRKKKNTRHWLVKVRVFKICFRTRDSVLSDTNLNDANAAKSLDSVTHLGL